MIDEPDWADEAEARLLTAALAHVEALGWTRLTVAAAARDTGLSLAEAELLLPEGARDLAALFARRHDTAALDRLAAIDPSTLKIRERIRVAVLARVDVAFADGAATRRWMGFLTLPAQVPLALRLVWASADALWRWAGDVATDENHYTKRTLLAEILVSTLAIRLSAGAAAAEAHLDGRIGSVMAFERWKGGLRPADLGGRLAARLGRLRYGGAKAPEPV
jgi:ubiquinone biosynthesis protein COQ9